MKKKQIKKLRLKTSSISNLDSNTIVGGASCEAPCQGGTSCCTEGCPTRYCYPFTVHISCEPNGCMA